MKRINKILILTFLGTILFSSTVYAYSVRHHLINMSRHLIEAVLSPLHGLFIQAPRNIKKAYLYEVWEREKPEKRGLLRYKLYAIWRAPGEGLKGVIDGLVGSVKSAGEFNKELLSIFFGD